MKPGRIVMLVLGTLASLLGLALLAGAGITGWANYQQRDGGYFTTPSERYTADSYALTSPRLNVMTDAGPGGVDPAAIAGSLCFAAPQPTPRSRSSSGSHLRRTWRHT